MKFCKNIYSGKYFIYIQYLGDGKLLLVTPNAEIKALEGHLFQESFEEDENTLISQGLTSVQQIRKYRLYKENRKEDRYERWEYIIDEMTPREFSELERWLESREEKSRIEARP